jgi:Beta protein
MGEPIFFPIARAKAGEIEAIGRLSPRARDWVRPMLDFPRQRKKDKRPLAQYLGQKLAEIASSWGTADEVYLDFSRYEPATVIADGPHIVDFVFGLTRQLQLKAVPVAAPLSVRGPGTDYFEAVARIAHRDERGAALRVPYEDFATNKTLERVLKETTALLDLSPSEVDVYLDANSLAFIPESDRDETELTHILRMAAMTVQDTGYRRAIFAASGMPGSLVRHKKGDILTVARTELRVWRRIVADPRFSFLRFGDYGVVDPGQVESDAQIIPPSRVRLSLQDDFRLYKGSRDAIRALSQSVMADGQLYSAQSSWGANAIRECAAGYGDPGGPSQWIARDFNMHIESTVAELAYYLHLEPAVSAASSSSRRSPWLQESFEIFDDS